MPRALVAVDFDGTLFRSDATLDPVDLAALEALAEAGVVRVLATGRSLFSLRRALTGPLPVDYVAFSCGSGVAAWPGGEIVRQAGLRAEQTRAAAAVLQEAGVDFMVQAPIPDNHRFLYWSPNGGGPDYQRRLSLYPEHQAPLGPLTELGEAAQLISIFPPGPEGEAHLAAVRERLAGDFACIRATSPIDHTSSWLEIFPAGTSKAAASDWLAEREGVSRARTMAVGNDWNDLHLLEWATHAYVVANAPAALRERFATVASHDERGVAGAIAHWQAPLESA